MPTLYNLPAFRLPWRMNGLESVQDEVYRAAGRRRGKRREIAPANAHRVRPDDARDRRNHRDRHLRADRHRGRQPGGPRDRAVVRPCGRRLRLRRPLLCRVRRDDPDRRQRLHLLVRDARRDLRLDDRLGPDSRVCGRLDDRRHRMERVLPADPRRVRHQPPTVDGRGAGHGRGRARQPAGDSHRPRHHGAPRDRRSRERAVQRGDGRRQAGGGPVLHRRRLHLRQAGELVAVRAVRVGRHHDRRRRRVLRLHRLRRRLDDGRGGQEPEQGPADRHHHVARHLYPALSDRRGDSHRHRPRRRLQERREVPQRAGGLRAVGYRQGLGGGARVGRCGRRDHERAAGHAHEPAAHLLFHEPGQPAAAGRQQGASAGSRRPTSRRSSRASSSRSPPGSSPFRSSAR